MGPWARCVVVGGLLPPPQPFQFPLPRLATPPPDYAAAKKTVERLVSSAGDVGAVARLALNCAQTFRRTDYQGGCSGARLFFPPESDFPENRAEDVLGAARKVVDVAVAAHPTLSRADAVVLAGGAALEAAGLGRPVAFCPGRADAVDGAGSKYLSPSLSGAAGETAAQLREAVDRSGLDDREWVAVRGVRGLDAAVSADAGALDVEYFETLADPALVWRRDGAVYRAEGKPGVALTATDLNVRENPALLAIVRDYAADGDAFRADLARAWPKLMNLDRFGAAC